MKNPCLILITFYSIIIIGACILIYRINNDLPISSNTDCVSDYMGSCN